MRKIDRRIVIVVLMVFIVGMAYGIMRFLIAQKEEPPSLRQVEARRYVKVEVVEYQTIHSPVSEHGRMSSVSRINLSAEASGKVIQGDIQLKQGANFKKGDVLFSIYPDEAELALKAEKSQFMNSLALLLPDLSIDYPEQEEKFREFFSSIDIDKVLPEFPDYRDEKLSIFLASRNIPSEYYTIRKDELQLQRHAVIAPFDGALTEVLLEPGTYTNTGGIVARAIRTDALELEVPLNRADASWVNIGDPVDVLSETRSLQWRGEVVRKSSFVNENTQSQTIFVRIDNVKDQPLLAGDYLLASLPGRPIPEVMEIPRNAVFNSNEVFLVKSNRLQKASIQVVKVNMNTLLFKGLQSGDTLVVQPLVNVYEGTVVTTSLDPQKPQGEGRFDKQGTNQNDKKKKRS